MALLNVQYHEYGYIKNNSGTKTAYDAPVDPGRRNYGTCYAAETNSINPSYRTYYSFATSSIPSYAIIDSATFTYYHYGTTYGIPGPGEGIQFKIMASIGHDFIGGSIDTSDWGGGTTGDNEKVLANYPSVPSSGTTNITINTAHINTSGDTDVELKETCNYSGGYGGTVTYSIRSHSNRGLKYAVMQVNYTLAGTSRFMLLGVN